MFNITATNTVFFVAGIVWVFIGAAVNLIAASGWRWFDNLVDRSIVLSILLLVLWPSVLAAFIVVLFTRRARQRVEW